MPQVREMVVLVLVMLLMVVLMEFLMVVLMMVMIQMRVGRAIVGTKGGMRRRGGGRGV